MFNRDRAEPHASGSPTLRPPPPCHGDLHPAGSVLWAAGTVEWSGAVKRSPPMSGSVYYSSILVHVSLFIMDMLEKKLSFISVYFLPSSFACYTSLYCSSSEYTYFHWIFFAKPSRSGKRVAVFMPQRSRSYLICGKCFGEINIFCN